MKHGTGVVVDVIKTIDEDFIRFQARDLIYWENSLKFWRNEKRRNRKAADAEYLSARIRHCQEQLKSEASSPGKRLSA